MNIHLNPSAGQAALFVSVFLGTLVTEEGTLATCAALMVKGKISFFEAFWANTLGIVTSNLLIYAAGYFAGDKVLQLPILNKMLTKARLERAHKFVDKFGFWVAPVTRFLPGVRVPVYATCGILRSPFIPFAISIILVSAAWVAVALKIVEKGVHFRLFAH